MAMGRDGARLAAVLSLASSTWAIPAAAGDLPAPVEAAIAEQRAGCAPEKVTLAPGFIARRDINGDGRIDYILDYGRFRCGSNTSYYCGSAGCTKQVFASLPSGTYATVLDENVLDLSFKTIGGKSAMVLQLHGTACGKVGVEPCSATLLWNGRTFKRRG